MSQIASATRRRDAASVLSRSAIVYGLKELARRAGVSREFFDSWQLEFDEYGGVDVFLGRACCKHIRFPNHSEAFWTELTSGAFRTSTAEWMEGPSDVAALVPNFKIPFSSAQEIEIGPLFRKVSEDRIECSVDLLTSLVLTLARFEETFSGPRDMHGRFTCTESIAWRGDFFHRPIVDEYGLALKEALRTLLPSWEPRPRRVQVFLGHDVDEIGLPFSMRNSLAHTLRRGSPTATARDLLASFTDEETAYQRFLRQLVQFGLDRGFHPATYWKSSHRGPHDTGYDPRNKKIRALIESFRLAGLELGIHLSYDTFDSPEQFRSEVSALQELLGERSLGGRQDFLRWSPHTWLLWDSMDLVYDASVGYADQIGFRAGTCHPFHPWLLAESREAKLLEIPLLAMDSALFGYLKLGSDEASASLQDCVARCKITGGVFTAVWHNTTMMRPAQMNTYRKLLEELQGCKTYDWRNSVDGWNWV